MAIVFQQTLPADVPIEMIDAVTEEMGVDNDPPDGMLVHTHFEKDGHVQVVDVWESAEHHQRFTESRLMPAMTKVAAANGVELPEGEPDVSVTEVHRLVRGR
jgi:uncharacterized protein YciU (UPF0263 family)